jgi:ApaG protein
MNDLPLLVLEELFRLLNLRDFIALSMTTRRLQQASLRDELWREQGARDFLLARATRDEYKAEFKMFGKWVDIYARMLRAIDALVDASGQRQLNIHDVRFERLSNVHDVRELASDPARYETTMFREAPRQLQLCWLLAPPFGDSGFPLLGAIDFYSQHIVHVMANFDMARRVRNMHHVSLFTSLFVVHNDTGAVLQPISGSQESDRRPCVHVADSVLDYLEAMAEKVRSGVFVLDRGRLSAIPVKGDSVVVAVTDGIKITASPVLAPSTSQWPDLQFVYEITIEGLPNVRRCRLSMRHWEITNVVDVVDGAGVVGNHPLVEPGSKFVYKSCCNMRIDLLPGHMGGYFLFESLVPGETRARDGAETIRATVPTFHFAKPRVVQLGQLFRNRY